MAGMARVIEYELVDRGGVGAVILNGRRIALCASFIHDTFGNMVKELLAILEGQQQEAEWVYFHGPRSTHLYLTSAAGRTAIALRHFRDFKVPRPRSGDPGILIGEGEVRIRDVVSDVIIAGSRMIEQLGVEGYLKAWRNPFPVHEFSRLKQLRRTLPKA